MDGFLAVYSQGASEVSGGIGSYLPRGESDVAEVVTLNGSDAIDGRTHELVIEHVMVRSKHTAVFGRGIRRDSQTTAVSLQASQMGS
jgi:hypothetical protein